MTSFFARFRFTLTLSAALLPILSPGGPVPANKPVACPDWWFEYDVIPSLNPNNATPAWPIDYPAANDYAAINQGQLKNIAQQAYFAMQAKGVVPPNSPITIMVTAWGPPVSSGAASDDYLAVNIGQLKNVAAPFYLLLRQLNYVGQPFPVGQPPTEALPYPWSNSANPPDDYALANIGQVKNLFSFVIPTNVPNDTDADGLPDIWELQYWSDLSSHGATDDPDSDGVDNLTEYRQGRNPTKGALEVEAAAVGLKLYYPTN